MSSNAIVDIEKDQNQDLDMLTGTLDRLNDEETTGVEKVKVAARSYLASLFRILKTHSQTRIVLAVLLCFVFIFTVSRRSSPKVVISMAPIESHDVHAEFPAELASRIHEQCIHVEIMRSLDDCIAESAYQRIAIPKAGDTPNEDEFESIDDLSLPSPYGLVLSYGLQYNATKGATKNPVERYQQSMSLKCFVGNSMSISWDLDFEDTWVQSYDFGVYPDKETGSDTHVPSPLDSFTCSKLGPESAASMALFINCGVDIERNLAGMPLGPKDHEALVTCMSHAYSWIQNQASALKDIQPWSNLCSVNSASRTVCNEEFFEVVKPNS